MAPHEASSSQGHNTECYKGALRGKTRRLNGEDRNERKLREAKIQEELEKMHVWMRKSWSTRARRWLKMMPADLRERNPWKESKKSAVSIGEEKCRQQV